MKSLPESKSTTKFYFKKTREVVNYIFCVDILTKSRKRDVVNARMIYSKILRDKHLSYNVIGKSILKNHASIIHYIKSIDWLLAYDKPLLNKYNNCVELLNDTNISYSHLSKSELILLIKQLQKQNNLLSLSTNV
tara:strand:+ start:1489 stop:1893 length:405 start_codon:yes stop_codon:yes gene_type:complete